jgi:hypothetical protein
MNKVLATLGITTVAAGLAVLPATGAAAAPSAAPPAVCAADDMLGSGPGQFSKLGGCASTVATAGAKSGSTTRAGYFQQCQVIRYGRGLPLDFDLRHAIDVVSNLSRARPR